MKHVVVFGTFDWLHPGHLHFFQQAKTLGDTLTVIVGTDGNVARIKGNKPDHSQEERIETIRQSHAADTILLAPEDYNYIDLLKRIKPDVIALGYDQQPSVTQLQRELKQNQLSSIVLRLKAHKPQLYKSSILKAKAKA
jgi:FAD synthetase